MSADGDTVRVPVDELLGELDRNAASAEPFLAVIFEDAARELRAALARLEAAERDAKVARADATAAEAVTRKWLDKNRAIRAQRDTLAEALRHLIEDLDAIHAEDTNLHTLEQRIGAAMLGFGGGYNHEDDLRAALAEAGLE